MQVKICGITNDEDLKNCENHKTAFIGFINVERSKRFLDIDEINELKNKMKNPEKAVLVLEPVNADEVINKSLKTGIKNVQLHSLRDNEIRKIKDINVIRAIGIPENMNKEKIKEIENFAGVCDYLLFDSMVSGKSGGTGKQIPLPNAEKSAEIARTANPDIKLILAGGMNKERINNERKKIIEIFNYIDVNSGVEDSPGIKNEYKINEFMESCSRVKS